MSIYQQPNSGYLNNQTCTAPFANSDFINLRKIIPKVICSAHAHREQHLLINREAC